MTQIDNSKLFLSGIYGDATVTIAANTTILAGTILGLNSSDKLVPYSTDLNVAYTPAAGDEPAVEAFIAEPTYILAQDLVNTTGSSVDYTMARVFESGEVDGSKVIFTKTADKTDAQVLAALKNNGFHLRNVEQMS